jgi:anti-sigma regulatory factor (Ser/Thr protein kinase)
MEGVVGMAVMLPTDVEFQIPTDGRYAQFVRKGVSLLALGAGFADDDCKDIEVAVGEAVTNAICHGKPSDGAGRVFVRCRLTPYRLIVEVEDEGDTDSCIDIPCSLPEHDNEHGRGWILMYNLMDRTTVRCTGNGLVVRLVKRRHRLRTFGRMPNLTLGVA